jgi:two-component system response regulator DegU
LGAQYGVVPKLKFLIAEDSPQMRRLMRTLVEDIAVEVHECTSGQEAVRRYFEVKPDWVLMDLQMRDGDGLTATREICRREPEARIVIVTEFDEDELRQAAVDAGAFAYMLKENLLRIRNLVNSR